MIHHNPPNDTPEALSAHVTSEFTAWGYIAIGILSTLVLPLGAVAVLAGLVWRVILASCRIGFGVGNLIIHGKPTDEAAWPWQCVRSFFLTQAESLPHWNVPLRKALLRLGGVRVGSDGFFGRGGVMDDYHPENIIIEDGAIISYGVIFAGHGDRERIPLRDQRVIIRRGAYIGTGVVLTPGVEIGEGATIGAGAVVTRDIPPHSVAVGVPARVITRRDRLWSIL